MTGTYVGQKALVTVPGAGTVATRALESGLSMVYQPIYDLRVWALGNRTPLGVEAFARFEGDYGPDQVFRAAEQAGFGIDLETRAVAMALEALERLPADVFVCVNVSVRLVVSGRLATTLAHHDQQRIVLDVIGGEQALSALEESNVSAMAEILEQLRSSGVRVALDDTVGEGALSESVLVPFDIVKIDRSVLSAADSVDELAALVQAAEMCSAQVIAEGIETPEELTRLIESGVRLGQGYHLAFPAQLDEVSALVG